MPKLLRFVLLCLPLFALSHNALAQQTTYSPYSAFGIGDLFDNANARNAMMGNIGYGTTSHLDVNPKNPAFYSDLANFTLDLSGFYREAWMTNTTSTERLNSGGIQGLTLGIPTNKSLAFAVGMRPYSEIGYLVNRQKPAVGTQDTFSFRSEGDGGINNFFLGTSVQFWRKHINLGVNVNYQFGNLNDIESMGAIINGQVGETSFDQQAIYGGWRFDLGISIQDTIDFKIGAGKRGERLDSLARKEAKREDRDSINVKLIRKSRRKQARRKKYSTWVARVGGVTYLHAGTQIDQRLLLTSMEYLTVPSSRTTDTIIDREGVGVTMPAHYGAGISLEVPFALIFGLDWAMTQWQDLEFPGRGENLRNNMTFGVGIEYVPAFLSRSYFNRVSYRAGIEYNTGILELEGQPISSTMFSAGFGFPVGRVQQKQEFFSRLNVGVQYHTRGTTDLGLYREQNLRIVFGVSFVQKWFQKRKYF